MKVKNDVIYLDNAATSFPKPDSVYEIMDHFLKTAGANPGRAGHRMAVAAEEEIGRARHTVAKFFNIKDSLRVVFTLNATDALNIGIKGLLSAGDHVVTSVVEHNSVSRPLKRLEDLGIISVTKVSCSAEGFIDPDDVRKAMTSKTKLVVLTHGSNVLGTIQPIREIGSIVQNTNAYFMVDAAQTAGVIPIDVEQDHIDFLAFPGHKSLFGPPGSGALYVSPRISLRPWREGGTGGDSISPLQPDLFPYFLEGGTPNTVGISGLGAGIQFIEKTGLDNIAAHEKMLRQYIVDALKDDERFTIYGPRSCEKTVSTISLRIQGVTPEEVGGALDQAFGIAVRSGLHCAPYIHRHIGTFPQGTVRLSPGFFNTMKDIETAVQALREVAESVKSTV